MPRLMHEPLATSWVHALSLPRSPWVRFVRSSLCYSCLAGFWDRLPLSHRIGGRAHRGMTWETLGNGWDILVLERWSFARRCPFIQQTFLKSTLGAGPGPWRGAKSSAVTDTKGPERLGSPSHDWLLSGSHTTAETGGSC